MPFRTLGERAPRLLPARESPATFHANRLFWLIKNVFNYLSFQGANHLTTMQRSYQFKISVRDKDMDSAQQRRWKRGPFWWMQKHFWCNAKPRLGSKRMLFSVQNCGTNLRIIEVYTEESSFHPTSHHHLKFRLALSSWTERESEFVWREKCQNFEFYLKFGYASLSLVEIICSLPISKAKNTRREHCPVWSSNKAHLIAASSQCACNGQLCGRSSIMRGSRAKFFAFESCLQ